MKLAYREYGEGQPLVILHGLFGQSDNWNTLARQFGEKGLRVFAVDQRNHGLSPHSDNFTFSAMADDLAEFISFHKLVNPILMGHSMGGKTVLLFQKQYGGIASKLIIADISPRAYKPHHQDVIEALEAVDLSVVKTRREAEEILTRKISEPGTREFLLKNLYWKEQQQLDWRFNLNVIARNYNNITSEVPFYTAELPVLVVRGENSAYVNDTDVADFKKRFSPCVVATIKGAGHWVHAEKPGPFFETVWSFIGS